MIKRRGQDRRRTTGCRRAGQVRSSGAEDGGRLQKEAYRMPARQPVDDVETILAFESVGQLPNDMQVNNEIGTVEDDVA